VTGSPSPGIENPLPVTVAPATITAVLPVEDRTSCCVAAELTGTLPNERLDELMPSTGAAAPRCTAKVRATPPTLAVSVAAWIDVTAETFAVKPALVVPPRIVTAEGTLTALLLLVKLTPRPPLGAVEFSVTVQLSVPAPVIDPLEHVNPLSTGTPVPFRARDVDEPLDALLPIVN
jgi:hypothetical protein